MACCLISTKQIPEPMLPYCNNNLKSNCNQNTIISIDENAFENVVCKMAAILFRPQCQCECTMRKNFQYQADSRFASSQWEMALLCNAFSHWLDASLESALQHVWRHGHHDDKLLLCSCLSYAVMHEWPPARPIHPACKHWHEAHAAGGPLLIASSARCGHMDMVQWGMSPGDHCWEYLVIYIYIYYIYI